MSDEKEVEENIETLSDEKQSKNVEMPNMSDNLDQDLTDNGGYKVDFYIHTYSKKRRRQEEKREVFLQSIEGHVEPGTVCAIIGPQNSGKERLLQLLSGRTNKHICLGEVHVNGAPFAAPQMRAMTSYLAGAGSTLVGQMTVLESVDFIAKLVLPSSVDNNERKQKVERVLEEVRLIKVKDRRIDGESNGIKGIFNSSSNKLNSITAEERVRVNLAQVLMEGKRIIFLNEPTAGLDLLAAERVIKDIIGLAEVKLLTIFVSLEHPTKLLLEKFHKALFLSKGRQVYFGRVRHTVDFFSRLGYPIPEETSIYDHVLGLTVPDSTSMASQNDNNNSSSNDKENENAEKYLDKLLHHAHSVFEEIQMAKLNTSQRKMRKEKLLSIKKNNYYIKLENDSYQHYPIPWHSQVKVLMNRFWIAFKRDITSFIWRFIITGCWIGLFWVFCNNSASGDTFPTNNYDLITSLTLGFAGIQGLSLLALPQAEETAKIFESDMNQNLYRPSAYVVAHLIVSFLSLPFIQAPVALCYFFILGLGHDKLSVIFKDLIYFGVILLFLSVISEVLSLSLALLLRRSHSVMYLSSCCIHFLWLLFSGGIIRLCDNVDNIVSTISYASPSKWALDGLLLVTLDTYRYEFKPSDFNAIASDENIRISGSDILQESYCFATWRHSDSRTLSFFALGGMLAILLLFMFISARLIQSGFAKD